MKSIYALILLLLLSIPAIAQSSSNDSLANKEGVAVGELGGASSTDVKSGKSFFGYDISVETTPIEHWLEIELGLSSVYGASYKETDIDLLIKKPWTFSQKLEFMLGAGPELESSTNYGVRTTSWSGEIALDFMYWPFNKHQFGFYAEPAYTYGFAATHDQSVGLSAGLLINIP